MGKRNATTPQSAAQGDMWYRLGAALRRERKACGLSVREIERRSGVTFRTLYAYERAEKQGGIDLGKLMALCSVIGCDPCALLQEAIGKQGKKPEKTSGQTGEG